MEQKLLADLDEVLESDDCIVKDNARWSTEIALFRDSILQQPRVTNRTPGRSQIAKAWERWKRERLLDATAENNIDTTKLYKRG